VKFDSPSISSKRLGVRRGLELIVDEPVAGHFYWSVLGREVFGEPRRVIDCAPGPYATHRQALDAGTVAIRRHMEPKPMVARVQSVLSIAQ
jgi:hypothetical protein